MTPFFKKKTSAEIIRKAYEELLNREPDEIGFNHFLSLLEKKEIDEKKLRLLIQDSDEYKRIYEKNQFTKKYDMTKNFYGKVWVGQDDLWYSDMFEHRPLLHKNFISYMKSKNDIKTVLEIGCGTGIYPIKFRKELFFNMHYTGIDISESAIQHCKDNSDFNFICGDFLKIDINQKFDLVFSHGAIDHVYDIDLFLKKIANLSRKHAYISAYYGYYPELNSHEMKYFENDGYYLNKLSVFKTQQTLLDCGLSSNEFIIHPQKGGHKDIEFETVIEIHKL